ncbi:contryphan-vn-tryptophan [Bacteriophage sp.]|nr:contryphan-vn-tryptophan [Caudoviricetes sp.]UOF79986.1 contryphan-vn-tryptophan [Bacteriophage sp.]
MSATSVISAFEERHGWCNNIRDSHLISTQQVEHRSSQTSCHERALAPQLHQTDRASLNYKRTLVRSGICEWGSSCGYCSGRCSGSHQSKDFIGVWHQLTSRPLARIVIAAAVPASVLIKSPEASTCPTTSGKVYVSPGCRVLELTMVLAAPAAPPEAMSLTVNVAAAAVVLVPVNLSMMVRVPPGAVY